MTANELMTAIAAVLTTAAELKAGTAFPESTAYIALGCDMDKWHTVRGTLENAGLITVKGYALSLTAKGRDLAEKCNSALAQAR